MPTGQEYITSGKSGTCLTRLDKGTKLVKPWSVKIFPGAREASIFPTPDPDAVLRRELRRRERERQAVEGRCTPKQVSEDDGNETRCTRAERRAATQMRRYCKANKLFRLATLTFACQTHDWGEVMLAVGDFRRQFRLCYGDRPMAIVIEAHKSGAFHVHVGMPCYVLKARLEEMWRRRGFVDIRMLGDRYQAGDIELMAAKVAGYLAGYVKKFSSTPRPPGCHRYEVTQGFQPESELSEVEGEGEAFVTAIAAFGGELPSFVWSSDSVEDWPGPPVRVGFW